MKFARTCIPLTGAVVLVVAGAMSPHLATAQPGQSEIDSANRLFQAGKFSEAGKLYSQIVAENPREYSATLQLVGSRCFPIDSTTRRNGWRRA